MKQDKFERSRNNDADKILDVKVEAIPNTIYPEFVRELLESLGAQDITEAISQVGINYYGYDESEDLLGKKSMVYLGIIYSEKVGVKKCFDEAIRLIGTNPRENLLQQPKGRRTFNAKIIPDRYELIIFDRNWKAEVPPDWFQAPLTNIPLEAKFVGLKQINQIAGRFQERLGKYFSTIAQEQERDRAEIKQLKSEYQAKVEEIRRSESRNRQLLEDKERLQRKAAWELISQRLGHNFDNALAIVGASNINMAGLVMTLTERFRSEFGVEFDQNAILDLEQIPEPPYPDDKFDDFLRKIVVGMDFQISRTLAGYEDGQQHVAGLKNHAQASIGVRLLPHKADALIASVQRQSMLLDLSLKPEVVSGLTKIDIAYDSKKLEQVFYQLMLNSSTIFAAEYGTSRRHKMRLKVQSFGGDADVPECYSAVTSILGGKVIMLSLKDNGTGIPHERKSLIWYPTMTFRKDKSGTGAGLPMCEEIIIEHRGRIFEDGDPPEDGADFKIFLPHLEEDS